MAPTHISNVGTQVRTNALAAIYAIIMHVASEPAGSSSSSLGGAVALPRTLEQESAMQQLVTSVINLVLLPLEKLVALDYPQRKPWVEKLEVWQNQQQQQDGSSRQQAPSGVSFTGADSSQVGG